MIEIKHFHERIFDKDRGPLYADKYVLVNGFSESAHEKFIVSCGKVLDTGQEFLPIVIDSLGGYVHSLLGMVDFLSSLKVRVVTICEGKAMSCGAILFAVGEDRYAGANSTLMVHDVSGVLWGKDIELQNNTKEVSRLNRKIYSLLDTNTKQKPGYWRRLVKENKYTDLYLAPNAAKKHGLVTSIGIPQIETRVSLDIKLVAPGDAVR